MVISCFLPEKIGLSGLLSHSRAYLSHQGAGTGVRFGSFLAQLMAPIIEAVRKYAIKGSFKRRGN